MEDYLVQKGLDLTLQGDKGKPEKMDDKEWGQLCKKALSLIRLSLADEVKCTILDEKTAESLWARLCADYTGTSMLDVCYWKKKLHRFSMKAGASLHDHISEYQGILSQLVAIGETDISEKDKALNLIFSLPDSYEHLITTILHGKSAKATIKLDYVIKSLKEYELRKKTQDESEVSSRSALSAEDNGSGGKLAPQKRKPKCHHCRKLGHMKKDCWKLHGRKEDAEGHANLADSAEADFCLYLSDPGAEPGWYLDTGSSSHICSDESKFSTYKSTSGRVIKLGNEEDCTVEGEGTVELKMTNGRKLVLKDVLHVPRLKLGIISLGTLEAQGCRYTARGGVLSVWKGRRRMIYGKRSKGFLYRLEGTTKTSAGEKPVASRRKASQPLQQSTTKDIGDRTSLRGGKGLDVGGVRAEVGNPELTPITDILVGMVRCPVVRT